MARPEDGLVAVDEALALERALAHPKGEAYCLWLRCEALAPMGRAADARQSARASHSIASRLGHREWTAAALKGQGAACLADGDLAGAEAAFRACLETARRLPIFSGWAAAGLASTLVRSGDLDAAEGYVDQVFREGTPTTHYEGRLAEVELAVARQDPEAASLAARALDLAEDGGLLQSAARLRCLLAACAGSGGDGHAGQTPTEAGASDRRVG